MRGSLASRSASHVRDSFKSKGSTRDDIMMLLGHTTLQMTFQNLRMRLLVEQGAAAVSSKASRVRSAPRSRQVATGTDAVEFGNMSWPSSAARSGPP